MKNGDLLTVEPEGSQPIRAGEIATFRDERGTTVTHRVLGREGGDGTPLIITQGDGRTMPDPAWSADRLVGRVTAAQRPPSRLARRLLSFERLAWWELAEIVAARLHAVPALRRLQHRVFPVQVTIREERRTPPTGEWLAVTCTAADSAGNAVGWQTVVRQGPDADTGRVLWLLFGLQVRLRYRGQGIARRLLVRGEAAVAREGGGRMYAFVRPYNHPSVALFSSNGWQTAAAPPGTVRVPELAECLCFIKDV